MTWTHPAFVSLGRLFEERTGVAFPSGRRASAELGMRRALERAGYDDPDRYRAAVARDHALFDDLVAELVVGETYFFREPHQFAVLRNTILPALRRLADGRPIRAWSAGCASGEEAYSLAMTFVTEGLADRSHVLATDVSRAALGRARQGVYTNWSLRDGSDSARPYLRKVGRGYRVTDEIRRLVTFEHLNLALDVYPSFVNGTWGVDLIFCRNVLIYFDRETVSAVAQRLFASLAEGGWLVTASSDPPLGSEAPFHTVVTDDGLFYQRPVAAPHPFRAVDGFAWPGLSPEDGSPRERDSHPGAPLSGLDAGRPVDAVAAEAHHVRTLANLDVDEAERACSEAAARHPFSTELHYLHAVLLLGLERGDDAVRAARRVVYLDRTLAAAHFLLGSILQQEGDSTDARRAYRNARDLAAARPPEEDVPLAEGETAGQLAERAARQLARLVAIEEVGP